MNRNEFNRFVAGIDLPGPGDLEGLRELTTLFPWFHSAHLVLLKGLRANSDIRFDLQLKASALSVSDREVLYHYLFLSPVEAAPEPERLVREEVVAPAAEEAEEIVSPEEAGEMPPPEEEEEILTPEKTDEILSPEEEEEILTPEKTREELIAEIEARLKELESYRQVTAEEQKPVIVDEMAA
ncbi:MAG: hypothetical protein ABR560_07115, partial [Bacteroidales bacterium]